MKKIFSIFVIALLSVSMAWGSAFASQKHFQAQVYFSNLKESPMMTGSLSELNLIKTGVTYYVLQRNTQTAETLLASNGWSSATTAKTNPVSTSVYYSDGTSGTGMIDFVCDPAESGNTYVDLIVVDTNGGFTAFVKDFTDHAHTVVIDETPGVLHVGEMWWTANTTNAVNTGVTMLANETIHKVTLDVVSGNSGTTFSVGQTSSSNEWINGASLTSTGYINIPINTYGTDFYAANVGANTPGLYPWGYTFTSPANIEYQASSASNTPTGFIKYVLSIY